MALGRGRAYSVETPALGELQFQLAEHLHRPGQRAAGPAAAEGRRPHETALFGEERHDLVCLAPAARAEDDGVRRIEGHQRCPSFFSA